MPKVVVTHNVADVEKWLGFKAERAEAIAGLGGSSVVDHVAKGGSTTVAISAEVSDVAAFEAALSAPPPAVAQIMQNHGVQPPLTIFVEG
jgi:hypothetical protein